MRTDLENELTRTLRAAGVAAPQPAPDFSDRLAARRRGRRRNRTVALVATATTLAVLAGGAVAAGLPFGGAGDPPPVAGPFPGGSMPTLDKARARPVAKAWPKAVVALPANLPDGRPFHPSYALGGDRYVGSTIESHGGFGLPVEVNARTGAVRELMPPGLPAGATDVGDGGMDVTGNHIVWIVAATSADKREFREVWTVPRAGGEPRRLATVEEIFVSVAEAGGTFYVGLRDSKRDGIYRVAAGGALEKVPGSEKYQLLPGGWAVEVDSQSDVAEWKYRVRPFWNVATGERRTPRTLDGVTPVKCQVELCVGAAGGSLVSYRADGTGPAWLTGLSFPMNNAQFMYGDLFLYGDRFVQVRDRPGGERFGVYLWDRATGTLAELDGVSPIEGNLIQMNKKGNRQYVVDLTRIR